MSCQTVRRNLGTGPGHCHVEPVHDPFGKKSNIIFCREGLTLIYLRER